MGTGTSASFSGTLTSLENSTVYYYRAYVIIGNTKYYYGAIRSFTTSSTSPEQPGNRPLWLELPGGEPGSTQAVNTWKSSGKRNYTYLYDKSMYTSMWVAYPLHPSHYGGSRSGNWKSDDHFSLSEQINVWDGSYGVNVGSTIYARGHQIPSGDRNATNMQGDTFVATNSTPQIQNTFNGSIWNNLETAVRDVTTAYSDTVYVVTGPVFSKVGENKSVTYIQPKHDTKKCPVPNYYWKVLLKVKRSGNSITSACAIGFWYEHREYSSTESKKWADYAVSVDQIEAWTGLDLFINLPASIASSAEQNSNWNTFKSF